MKIYKQFILFCVKGKTKKQTMHLVKKRDFVINYIINNSFFKNASYKT